MEAAEYSLFNASDQWVLHYVDDPVFEESLLLNVLFQDKILMHESYFFNSSLLARHMLRRKGRLSFFEYAAQRGLIVPAIRNTNVSCLADAYDALEVDFFKNYQLLSPEMQPFKDRVIGAVDAGLRKKNQEPFYWPKPTTLDTNLGHRYYKLLKSVFHRTEIPEAANLDTNRQQLFERVWEQSKRWRYECLEQAAQRTIENGNHGIQRLELFRSIGWSLGIPKTQMSMEVQDVLRYSNNPETRLAIEVFLKWLAQCHHLTQAQVFETAINFPVYDLDEDFLLDSLFTSKTEDVAGDPLDVFRCVVRLPPLEALISLAPQEVIAIRDDLGEGYRVSLKRWQQNPIEANRYYAVESLKDYCEMISERYEEKHLEPLVLTYCASGLSRHTSLLNASTAVASRASSGVGWLISCAKLVCTTYQFITKRRIKSRLSPDNSQLEVTLADTVKNFNI